MVVVPVATVTTINSGHDGEDDDEVSLEHPLPENRSTFTYL